MANEQISFGIQAAIKLLHQTFLFRLVKIDHHIAAENNVIALGQELRFQIVEIEVDHFFERLLDGVPVANLVEIAETEWIVHGFHLCF